MVGLYYGNLFGAGKTVGYASQRAADGSVPVRRMFYAACFALIDVSVSVSPRDEVATTSSCPSRNVAADIIFWSVCASNMPP